MNSREKQAIFLMTKTMVGNDIMECALTDLTIDPKRHPVLAQLVLEAREKLAAVTKEFDLAIGASSAELSDIYEECEKSVNYKLNKLLKF